MVEPLPEPLLPEYLASQQSGSELDGQMLFTEPARNGGLKWGRGAVVIIAILSGIAWSFGWLEPLADLASPMLCEVTGRVLYNGKPLTKGFVQTMYERGGRMGTLGPIEADGTFRLTTNGDPGAYSGRHRVIVLSMDGGIPPKSILPQQYTQPETSPLVIQVSRTGPNKVELELVDTATP